MTREEANARLSELTILVRDALLEANRLCRDHQLAFDVSVDTGLYTHHLTVDRFGGFDTWESSNEDWNDSGCSDTDWDSSDC